MPSDSSSGAVKFKAMQYFLTLCTLGSVFVRRCCVSRAGKRGRNCSFLDSKEGGATAPGNTSATLCTFA